MPLREILGKTIGFGLTAAALAVGGLLVLIGNHAYNDYFNVILGWGLVLLGLLAAGYGSFAILAILYDRHVTEEEQEVHITPRAGAPGPPPPWGMGDIGRPGGIAP
jgi:crotonobetainyl-CoA:carnitine CoA-transferase CaiB-like acyl-CoA transferase